MLTLLPLVAMVVVSGGNAQSTPAAPDLTDAEKLYGLSLYWKEASDHFAFFDRVPELNWDQAYQDAIPKVLQTKTKGEYYRGSTDSLPFFATVTAT